MNWERFLASSNFSQRCTPTFESLSAIAHGFALLETDPDIGRPLHDLPELHELIIAFGDTGRLTRLAADLRAAGLRPTRQRVALAAILFGRGHRHIAAEGLHEEAVAANVPVSLATVYNTLHQFTEAGLLREVAINGARTYFDTNVSDHHHFFVEGENRLIDVESPIAIDNIPEPPPGMELASVEVIVRVRRKPA